MSHQRHQTQSLEGIVNVHQHGRVGVELVEPAPCVVALERARRRSCVKSPFYCTQYSFVPRVLRRHRGPALPPAIR